MDNNNSLPYGAISANNDNLQLGERHFVPEEPASARNNVNFNPLLVARNVNLNQPDQNNRNSYHLSLPTRISHSPSRNNPYRVPHLNYNTNSSPGQNVPLSPSNLSDSNVPSIINNTVPCRDNQGINNQLSDTRIVNTSSKRYFHPPWSAGDRTQGENSRVSPSCLDTSMNDRAAHLPIIKEEGTPSGVISSVDTYRSRHTGLKRRVSREDPDDSLSRPATKALLTEEKMAAKMHNLSISNDHCYHLNGLQTHLMGSNGILSNAPFSSVSKSGKDDEEHKEDDNNNMESGDTAMFVLAPGIKEVLANKSNQLLPQSLIDQMSKPCLAVIPWTPQDDVMAKISLNFNKTDDEKAAEKNTDYFRSKIISDNSSNQANALTERVVQTDAMYDFQVETFEFDEDEMDL